MKIDEPETPWASPPKELFEDPDGGGGGGGGDGGNSWGGADGERRGGDPATATDAVLGLDLKGPALTPSIAARLADLATSLGLEERILIYVWGTATGDRGHDVLRLLAAEHPSVPVGLALRDHEAKHWDHARVLRPDALRGVRALVPSIKFDAEWYAAAAASGLLTFSWVVDDDDALLHALTSRVSACISNEPGRMIKSLRAMYRGCMGT